MWFWDRWRIYFEYKDIPQELHDAVVGASLAEHKCVDKECNMIIPARSVIWAKKEDDIFNGYGCDPALVARNTVFVSPDMISDHLCEMYEDALDELLEKDEK